MPNIGFRILPPAPAPASALIEGLRDCVTAHLSDNMNRLASVCAAVRPYHDGTKLVGPALTVKVPPGDNLMVHKAIDIARPGDVIVVDAGGELTQAIIGEIMSRLAHKRGVAGMVIDGAIRDAGAIAQSAFPVYARGITHRGPYKDGPGEINVPVAIGGLVIAPGDIIVGDEDGLVAVAPRDAEQLIAAARATRAKEDRILADIDAGKSDRSWVDVLLRARGCEL